jgi:hypothetical protein
VVNAGDLNPSESRDDVNFRPNLASLMENIKKKAAEAKAKQVAEADDVNGIVTRQAVKREGLLDGVEDTVGGLAGGLTGGGLGS